MKLYTIWVHYAGNDGPDLHDAWDEWTREDNLTGWDEAVAKVHKGVAEGDFEDMRVIEIEVGYEDIRRTFETPSTKAKVA